MSDLNRIRILLADRFLLHCEVELFELQTRQCPGDKLSTQSLVRHLNEHLLAFIAWHSSEGDEPAYIMDCETGSISDNHLAAGATEQTSTGVHEDPLK